MARRLRYYVILVCFPIIKTVFTKDPEPELPPCPTNFQFLPQTLPMHCKMPSQPYPPGHLPPQLPPFFPGPVPGNPENPAVPNPGKPPVPPPAFPPPMPMGMGPPLPMGMPGMPMGMPMLGGPPQAKLPVIVMPFYSPDPSYKDPRKDPRQPSGPYKRKIRIVKKSRHYHDSDTDKSSDTDSSDTDTDTDSDESDRKYWNWKNRRSMRRRKKIRHARKQEYLTPILQYVSKDGFVIYEKKISKGEAKDWLGDSKGQNEETGNMNEAQEINNKYGKDEEETKPKRFVKASNRDSTSRDSEHGVVIKNVKQRQRKQSQQSQQGQKNKQH